jgi:hypothetical protein
MIVMEINGCFESHGLLTDCYIIPNKKSLEENAMEINGFYVYVRYNSKWLLCRSLVAKERKANGCYG